MGGFLSNFWDSSKNGDETGCDTGSESEDWLEEMKKDYGHPSWSQVIGKRLSKRRRVTVKVIESSDKSPDNLDLASVVLSKEFKRLDSEIKEELGVVSETPEELDNVRNTLEELGEENDQENDNVMENIDTGNEVIALNSPVDIEEVGIHILLLDILTGWYYLSAIGSVSA